MVRGSEGRYRPPGANEEVLDVSTGLLILRVVVGALFFAHGTQKLFGWFGGYGIRGTGGFLESLGYPQGHLMAAVTGVTEAGAGILLAAGFATPLAGAMILGVMLNAIWSAKRNQGVIGGYELDLVYAAVGATVAFTGAGAYSVDRFINDHYGNWTLYGWRYGVGAIVLALATGVLTLATRRSRVPAGTAVTAEDRQAA
jgi:putative oxidoreductase